MLHSYTLRQQLQMTRQELSYALYQQDAAFRVIARQDKEVDREGVVGACVLNIMLCISKRGGGGNTRSGKFRNKK